MRRRRRPYGGPSPSVDAPRPVLLAAVLQFACAVRRLAEVRRLALIGSLTTAKAVPKDADLLVVIDHDAELEALARAGRRLKGAAQKINLGADIFLADESGAYLGRICRYKVCHPRAACQALNCGLRDHLNNDLGVVTLPPDLIAAPPLELWPKVVRRCAPPEDVETLLLARLDSSVDPL